MVGDWVLSITGLQNDDQINTIDKFEHDVILRNNKVVIEPDLEYTRVALGNSLDL
jgi:hypothetical protein